MCPFKRRDMSVMTRVPIYSSILIFSTLCIVHDRIFQRKLSRRRLPITFVSFVSHAGAQALRPITFTQRFRTTRYLISIQLLRKPEILNLEDIRTKFERSKGDLVSFQATRYVCYDKSAKFCSLILIFSTLCVVHDQIFQRKLSRRRLPITFSLLCESRRRASVTTDHVYATF